MGEKVNKEEIWNKCLSYIKNRIQETAFQTWFDDVRVSSVNKEDITLLVPNKFHYEWLESKYRALIDESIKSVVSHPLIVNYTVPVTSKSSSEIPSFIEKKDVSMASAEEVKTNTGFSIGGVAPVAHTINLDILVDKSLSRFPYIFAAAGHPNCVFKITYDELVKITNGSEKEISE